MAFSRVSYTANGATSEFTIPFPFLRVDTLQVRVNNLLKTLGTDYTVNESQSKIVFASPPFPNYEVLIKRVTPRQESERIVIFSDPSDIRADVLNAADLQLLYIVQEALDDIAEGVGVGAPTGPADPDAPLPTNVQNALDGVLSEVSAQLATEASARAAAILAEANARATAILGEQNARAAAIASEQTTRQTADTSLASQLNVLNAAVTDPSTGLAVTRVRLLSEEIARATADTAAASRLTALETSVNNPTGGLSNLAARLSTVEGSLTGGTSPEALAFRVSTLEATATSQGGALSTLTARVASEEAARANADSALSTRVTSVESSVGTLSASVTTEATTRATQVGQLAAEYVLSVITGGGGVPRIGGFRVTNVGGAAGYTEFVIQSDRFKVVNPSGLNARLPFQIINGFVYIDEAAINTLSVGKLTGGSITGQDIILATAGGGQLTSIHSANYSPGSAGFTLRSDGYFECKDGVFRGSVLASTITGSTINGGSINIDDSGSARFCYSTFQTDGSGVGLELGFWKGGNNSMWIDFHSAQDAYADFAARVIREAGPNGNWGFVNQGGGNIEFYNADGSGDYRFIDNRGQRLRFGSFTASGGSVAGYIIVKTDDGVERKLAVLN